MFKVFPRSDRCFAALLRVLMFPVPYSGFVSNVPHHPCAPLQPRAGRAAGGVSCCRLPCSEPSPAPRSESGPCRRCLVRQTRSRWVTCWTSRLRAPRAGCRYASTL